MVAAYFHPQWIVLSGPGIFQQEGLMINNLIHEFCQSSMLKYFYAVIANAGVSLQCSSVVPCHDTAYDSLSSG